MSMQSTVSPAYCRDTESNPHIAGPRLVECRVRLAREGLGVVSPRTGRILFVPELAAPVAIRQRIVHAAGSGCHTLTMTLDDLKAFAAAAIAPVVNPPTPRTTLWNGWRRPRNRRGR